MRRRAIDLPEEALALGEQLFPHDFERHATLAFFLLRVLSQQCNDRASAWLAPLGLTWARYRYLVTLFFSPERELTLDEISKLMFTSNASVSVIVNQLAAERLVERLSNAHDARSVLIRLLPKGIRLMEKAVPLHHRRMEAAMKRLSLSERKTLVSILKKIDFADEPSGPDG